ncbi:hypothetical protein BD410DRAFT_610761 [Rickenella mellea]|uniref:Uncharacterized protein n=1 Tax=Rickenella mellea TaxID=50990 RepID=A0A4Y7QG88_9AGAM|nr:hypothetical protein BD410DRAFT_610761 [Rickenella mellea]
MPAVFSPSSAGALYVREHASSALEEKAIRAQDILVASDYFTLVFQTLFGGMFYTLFVVSLYVILANKRPDAPEWSFAVWRGYVSYVQSQDVVRGAARSMLTLRDPKAYVRPLLYMSETLVADVFMIYRVYVVWGHNTWVTLPPAICTACTLVGNIIAMSILFTRSLSSPQAFPRPWVTMAFTATLISNVLCSSLIAYRLWKMDRSSRAMGLGGIGLFRVLSIFMESAAIVCVCLLVNLVLNLMSSPYQVNSLSVTMPIIGIAWCLIVIRVDFAMVKQTDKFDEDTSSQYITSLQSMPDLPFRTENRPPPTTTSLPPPAPVTGAESNSRNSKRSQGGVKSMYFTTC